MPPPPPSSRPAIASMSLGRAYAGHDLRHKLAQAARAGFAGVEIFYEDLEYEARTIALGRPATPADDDLVPSTEDLLEAARRVTEKCDELGLEVVGLQPFLFYEGVVDRVEREGLIRKLAVWFRIVRVLGTDVIQIPTQFRRDDGVTGEVDVIVRDLREVAELGLRERPVVRFAYENLAWGTFVDTWEGVWEVVKRVDRGNFGMCLDTFNISGRIWADPAREGGKVDGDADEILEESMEALVKTVDVKKVFYVQVVGAELLEEPLVEGHPWHVDGQPSRMSWSRNARLFYGEEERGQYLPIDRVARAILDPVDSGGLGFKGWVSMELFSRTMNDPREEVPAEHAQRGAIAWEKLRKSIPLE